MQRKMIKRDDSVKEKKSEGEKEGDRIATWKYFNERVVSKGLDRTRESDKCNKSPGKIKLDLICICNAVPILPFFFSRS